MLRPFRIDTSDLWFEAVFAEPAFGLFRDNVALYQALLRKLGPYGLTADQIKYLNGDGTLGDVEIQAFLFRFTGSVRVRVGRVEIRYPLRPESPEAVVVDSLEAIAHADPNAAFSSYQWALNLHGFVDGLPSKEFVTSFAQNSPTTLGTPAGTTTGFYYGPDGARQSSFLSVDLSAAVEGAVYLRLSATWAAPSISFRDLPSTSRRYVDQGLEGVGLRLQE